MSQIKPMTEVRQKQPRIKDNNYLAFIRMCDCIVCGASFPSEAAHIRYAAMRYGKLHTGMGQKPDDKWTIPLCARCHRVGDKQITAQHQMSERKFWKGHKIDPLDVATRLYACNNDVPKMRAIVNEISVFARIG